MNSNSEVQEIKVSGKQVDAAKWALASVIVCLGIFGYHYYEQYPAVYRGLALIPVFGAAVFVAVLTSQGASFWSLMREAVTEARRVVWPTRQETLQTTGIVGAVVFVMALILWLLDAAFGKLISLIIS